jgi:tetratricopeptide (TPR) repeat protein
MLSTKYTMDVDEAIKAAFQYFQEGNSRRAETICAEILSVCPDNADVLHLLGMISYERMDYVAAKGYIKRSLRIDPSEASAYFNLANVLREERNFDEAVSNYQKALLINPELNDAYYNLGIIFEKKEQIADAIACYEKAIRIDPYDADAYNNLGIVLQKAGRLDDAVTNYQTAVQMKPDNARTYYNLGSVFYQKKQFDEAIRDFQKALQLNPEFADAYGGLGNSLKEKGLLDEAVHFYQKAIRADPNRAETYYNLGIALKEKGSFGEAIRAYQKAVQLKPDSIDAYNNLGIALQDNRQIEEAIVSYKKALNIDQDDAVTHWNLSHALLLSGNFKDGWKEYEWRLKVKDFYRTDFHRPLWDGSDISGRTILLQAEQGFGDTMQFIRYAPLVAQSGIKVIVGCPKELTSLLQNVEGVEQTISYGERLPEFDFYCPVPSLPFIFGTTSESIPVKIPYINTDSLLVQLWMNKLKDDHSVKIGLVWAGREQRTFSLDLFSPLSLMKGVSFYSLQKGKAAKQVETSSGDVQIVDYTGELNDFSDTAAFIVNLDLIITVDTAVAHLSGALGKPVWTLLPAVPDWRWMLDRKDSPWYPTMRLFRQSLSGDWETLVQIVAEELSKYLQTQKGTCADSILFNKTRKGLDGKFS